MAISDPKGSVSRHIAGLDGLRGLAALVVVVHHVGATMGPDIAPNAQFAVDFFFLLSGFVVARAYEEKIADGRLSLRNFALTRIIRLYPVIFLGLAISVILHLYGGLGDRDGGATAYLAFLMLPCPSTRMLFPLNVPLWSLLMELIANAVHAGLLLTVDRRRTVTHAVVYTVAGFAFLIAAVLHYRAISIGSEWETIFGGLARVAFSYGFGVLLYRARDTRLLRSFGTNVPFALSVVILLALLIPTEFHLIPMRLGFIVLLFPLALLGGLKMPEHRSIGWLAGLLGRVSYPLYALHMPIFTYLGEWDVSHDTGAAGVAFWAVAVVVLVGACLIVAEWYEKPIIAILRRRERRDHLPAEPAPRGA